MKDVTQNSLSLFINFTVSSRTIGFTDAFIAACTVILALSHVVNMLFIIFIVIRPVNNSFRSSVTQRYAPFERGVTVRRYEHVD